MDNNQLETNNTEQSHEMASHEDYEKSFKKINRGDYLIGTVVKIESNGVYVDVGYKQEGFIPLNQLAHTPVSNPEEVISVGEELPIVVLKCNDMEGGLILSKKRADLETAWRKVTESYGDGSPVTATVVEAVKGGLLVDLGLRGFVPASQVDLRPVKDLNDYVGEALTLRVIELDRSRRKVVLSRKKVLEEERSRMKEETMKSLYEGQIVRGTVARLTNFGAFINLGGVDGLVHISEISWKRIKHPSEVLKVSQEVDVMVLKVDTDRERISLSIRQALPDPWFSIGERVKIGDVIKGTVTKVAPKYAFVEVAEGVEGVVPIGEIADRRINRPDDVIKENQPVDVKILELNPTGRRMLLSIKQAVTTGTRDDVSRYNSGPSTSQVSGSSGEGASIGDILRAKMKEKAREDNTSAQVESTETKNETIEEPETEKNPEIKPETASIKEPEAVTTKEETQPQEKIEEKKNPYAVSISDD